MTAAKRDAGTGADQQGPGGAAVSDEIITTTDGTLHTLLDDIQELKADLERCRCACGHLASEHYGEESSCMGDAPNDPTGTVYCACTGFTVDLDLEPVVRRE